MDAYQIIVLLLLGISFLLCKPPEPAPIITDRLPGEHA